MKKVLLVILAAVLVLGVLAGAGYAGYQVGYSRAAQSTGNPLFATRVEHFGPKDMPMHDFGKDFDRGFDRGMSPDGFGRMHHGHGFGFFSPILFLIRIAVLGLIVWLVYKMFRGNGWQLTFTRHPVENVSAESNGKKKKTG